jgi:hypothetical protein
MPQLVTSLSTSASHPSAKSPLQSLDPATQLSATHSLDTQVALNTFAPPSQVSPHAPQSGAVDKSVSQPLVPLPSQSP